MTANATPYVIQALSHPADNFRRAQSFVALGQQGVRSWVSGDMAVSQNGTPNMSVNVAAGQCLINGTQNTTSQGSYHGLNDATVNLTIAASDPTNPRIDIVVAQVEDAAYSGANNDFKLSVVTGTPAPSPSPPATPNNAIVLAQVAVAANVTSITNGNITDKRPVFGLSFHAAAHLSTNFTLPGSGTGNGTLIPLDTIEADPNGNFNVSTHLWTAPVAGNYNVAFSLRAGANNAAQDYVGTVIKNGGTAVLANEFLTRSDNTGDGMTVASSKLIALAAGDTLGVYGLDPNTNSLTIDSNLKWTFLTVHFVSGN